MGLYIFGLLGYMAYPKILRIRPKVMFPAVNTKNSCFRDAQKMKEREGDTFYLQIYTPHNFINDYIFTKIYIFKFIAYIFNIYSVLIKIKGHDVRRVGVYYIIKSHINRICDLSIVQITFRVTIYLLYMKVGKQGFPFDLKGEKHREHKMKQKQKRGNRVKFVVVAL